MQLRRPAGLVAAVLLACASGSLAQDDPAQLETTFRQVAKSSIPRTVLVKAIVDEQRMGSGSGAIISADGWILTCSHVVELGKSLEIVTSDGKTYPGKLAGWNKRQDYALVKIDAQGLDAFPLGDSTRLRPGDWVVGLGHPGGPYPDLMPSFAAGQVRGLNAQLVERMMGKFYDQALVTDVPIFSGNSGGPLVNLQGELVGINAAIIQINELAFSIPMHEIQPELEQLKAGKHLPGIAAGPEAWKKMQELISPEDMARMQKRMMERLFAKGGRFGDILRNLFGEGGPGGQGGMPDMGQLFERMFGESGQPGEMPDMGELFRRMFGEGGQPGERPEGMPDLGELFERMFGGQGGQPGEMPDMGELFRRMFGEGGQPGEQPEGMPDMGELFRRMFGQGQEPERPQQPAQGSQVFLGLRAAQGAPDVEGVLVEEALADGPAAQAGVRKGDVIRSLDGQPLRDFPALRAALAGKRPGEQIVLGLERPELEGTVVVQKKLEIRVTLGSR